MRRRALLAALPALVLARLGPVFADEVDDEATFEQFVRWGRENRIGLLASGVRVQAIATHPLLLGRPYRRGPLEGAEEILRTDFAAFDCVTFVETVLALSTALAQGESGFEDYRARLAAIRYRDGQRSYCTRLHYFGDWARANVAAIRLAEVTNGLQIDDRPLPTMTAPAGYKVLGRQLANSRAADAVVRRACIAAMEGSLARELPAQRYLPNRALRMAEPALEAGDVLAWVSARKDVDVVHLSIVRVVGERRGLVHASLREGRVAEVGDVAAYAARLGDALGVRVFRPI